MWVVFLVSLAVLVGGLRSAIVWSGSFGGWRNMLDGKFTKDQANAALRRMGADGKRSHLRMTRTVDRIIPFAHATMVFSALQLADAAWWLFFLPAVALTSDLFENRIQIAALEGDESHLWAKSIVTSTKFLTLVLGIGVALYLHWRQRLFVE